MHISQTYAYIFGINTNMLPFHRQHSIYDGIFVVADSEFIFTDSQGGVSLYNAENLTTKVIMTNSTFVSIHHLLWIEYLNFLLPVLLFSSSFIVGNDQFWIILILGKMILFCMTHLKKYKFSHVGRLEFRYHSDFLKKNQSVSIANWILHHEKLYFIFNYVW